MKEKLWTKDFWAITIISFIIFFVFYVLLTLLPIYISDRLHASPDKAGLLVTLFLIAAIVIRPFAGQWVGKYSNKTILGLSSLAFWWSLRCILFATQLNHCFLFGCFMVLPSGLSLR